MISYGKVISTMLTIQVTQDVPQEALFQNIRGTEMLSHIRYHHNVTLCIQKTCSSMHAALVCHACSLWTCFHIGEHGRLAKDGQGRVVT